MSTKYPGGFITKSPVAPTASAASGMWTLDQAMQLKKQGLWPAPPPAIGSAFGGGFFAGQISTNANGIADYNLVVGPLASAQSILQWKTTNTSTSGTSSDIDGPANSAAMNDASHPAAQFCEGLTIGGFSDWYMPAKNEVDVCYFNLKPTTQLNNDTSGINPNAIPPRPNNYTNAGPPYLTSAANFQSGGSEAFTAILYWTSTQADGGQANSYAWMQTFDGGRQQKPSYKTNSYRVRAVRRVPV